MTRTKLGLLGLCAVALGLMTFGATGAQAEGTWLILDGKGGVKTNLPAIVEFEKDKNSEGVERYTLHTEILKIKVLFLCTNVAAVNAMIFGAGAIGEKEGVEKNSKVLFSGCITELNGKASPECTPKDPTDGEGFIVTKAGHGLVVLHELAADKVRDDIVIMLPDEGETFAVLSFGASCVIGTSVPVIGKLALKDSENMALVHLVKHLFAAFTPLTELFVISKTAEHATTFSGAAWAKLGGAHTGLAYSISNL
jgi:hypothetical protein